MPDRSRQRPLGAHPLYWASFRSLPPEDWAIRQVADLATTFKGKLPSRVLDTPNGQTKPYLLMDGLRGGTYVYTEETHLPSVTEEDTVLIADGSKSGFAVRGVAGVLGSTLLAFRAREHTNPSVLFHLLSSLFPFLNSATTGTAIPHLDQDLLLRLCLAVPAEPSEQAAIARILDAVDTALERSRAAVTAATSLGDALMHALLERGIGKDGRLRCPETMPDDFVDTKIGRIPRSWRVEPLSCVADIDRGRFSPRPRNDPRYYNGPYPFIQTGQVAEARGRVITTFTQSLNAAGKAVSREFPAGTIMVTIAANIGETAILGVPMCAPDSLVGVTVKEGHVPRYVELCLRRLKPRLSALAPRSAQANINLTFLKPLRVPVPQAPEQKAIAALVDGADAQVQAIEAKVEALQALKKSLMHDLLTGRVRVNPAKVAAP